VRPTPESLEQPFEQLADLNAKKFEKTETEQVPRKMRGAFRHFGA
jgi:hypothetical protein